MFMRTEITMIESLEINKRSSDLAKYFIYFCVC